jgi:hypothetical protein
VDAVTTSPATTIANASARSGERPSRSRISSLRTSAVFPLGSSFHVVASSSSNSLRSRGVGEARGQRAAVEGDHRVAQVPKPIEGARAQPHRVDDQRRRAPQAGEGLRREPLAVGGRDAQRSESGDEASVLRVVLEPAELRERQA